MGIFDFNLLTGSLIVGSLLLIGIVVNGIIVRKRNNIVTLTQTNNFLKAIKDEINVFWELYLEDSPILLEEVSKYELFTFYNNNSTLIFNVEFDSLIKNIEKVFFKAKELLAYYQLEIKPLIAGMRENNKMPDSSHSQDARNDKGEKLSNSVNFAVKRFKLNNYNLKTKQDNFKTALEALNSRIDEHFTVTKNKVI